MKHIFWILTNFCFCTIFSACYPGGAETVEDLDAVATSFDPNFDFMANRVYFMPDTIIHITNNPNESSDLSRTNDAMVLGEIAMQLESKGYSRYEGEDLEGNIDVVVLVTGMSTTQQGVSLYPVDPWGWWGGYGGWGGGWGPGFGPGWGWGGGAVAVPFSVETGSLMIEMLHPNGADPSSQNIPRVWVAAITGMLRGNPQDLERRLVNGAHAAFSQSPYLGQGTQ